MEWFHRPLLLIGLVTIIFSVVGSQTGSFQYDSDQRPETPMVAVSNPVSQSLRGTGKNRQQHKVVLVSVGIQARHLGIDDSVLVSHDRRSTLRSLCMLRC